MKVLQYVGPFSQGDSINIKSAVGYTYVQIGIQIPKRQPIARQKSKKAKNKTDTKSGKTYRTALEDSREEGWTGYGVDEAAADVRINGTEYRVSSNDILEFDNLAVGSWDIEFLKDLPWGTIIDIMYSELELV